MPRVLRILLIVVAVVLVAGFVAVKVASEPRPSGKTGPAAEALADKMLAAVNAGAWDTTTQVAWDFAGRQQHAWRRDVDSVTVTWDDHRVDLYTETVTGRAFTDGQAVTGEDADELVQQAWGYFCNDGFWLAAPFKIRDPGTERALVRTDDGRDALLVTYASGGVTPGDAYLWHLDDAGLPTSYQMWVSIIPVGGLAASWDGWVTLPSGARVATRHKIGPVTLEVDVKG